jgi:hypothetical protein
MADKEFYSVKEIAQILNLSPDRVYEYLRTGHLYGSRLTKHGVWRIPAAELQRLKGTSLGKSSAQLETKPVKWSEYLELAVQLQNSLSHIEPKDWAIWGLPDSGEPPLTSGAGLKIWMDRGKLVIKLAVEQDKRFPLFLARLKTSFPEFNDYDQWRKAATNFIRLCWTMAQEIWSRAEQETGLPLSPIEVMGKGHMINVPQFIYEFALDNYSSGKQPDLGIFQSDPYRYGLVPADLPSYILAISSKDEMEMCKKVTISLTSQYVQDERIGEINDKALQMKKQTAPFQSALSTILRDATRDG